MREELIGFEVAKLAKEKGFPQLNQGVYFTKEKEHCLVGWGFNDRTDNSLAQYSAPTQSLLQRWLREEHNKIILIGLSDFKYSWKVRKIENNKPFAIKEGGFYNTYEEALEKGLQETLKLIKNEEN